MLRIKLGMIPVKDYDRAIRFYTEKMGFKVITDVKFGENQRWVKVEIPNAETQIAFSSSLSSSCEAIPCSNIIFGSENVEAEYEKLSACGVEFTQKPKKESWGTSAFFKDSEGNIFCIGSYN